jgi:DNA-binding transcriptional regulator YiaG
MTLGDQLRRWRKGQQISQSLAAIKLKVPLRTLQHWEQGRMNPRGLAREALLHKIGIYGD